MVASGRRPSGQPREGKGSGEPAHTRPADNSGVEPVYPVMLRVRGKRCVVVGGGKVAERKVAGLLECGAEVVVVAPEATPALQGLAQSGRVQLKKEMFHVEHLNEALLVIAATDDEEVNIAVAAARDSGILVNVVDSPELCSFYVPASVRRGNLTISVSTAGESPALAARLQDALEATYGEEYGLFSQLLGEFREEVKASLGDEDARRQAWHRVLDNSDEILALLRLGQVHEAQELMRHWLFSL